VLSEQQHRKQIKQNIMKRKSYTYIQSINSI
jgi:hypothetical protein